MLIHLFGIILTFTWTKITCSITWWPYLNFSNGLGLKYRVHIHLGKQITIKQMLKWIISIHDIFRTMLGWKWSVQSSLKFANPRWVGKHNLWLLEAGVDMIRWKQESALLPPSVHFEPEIGWDLLLHRRHYSLHIDDVTHSLHTLGVWRFGNPSEIGISLNLQLAA